MTLSQYLWYVELSLMKLSHIKGQLCLLPCVHLTLDFLLNLWMALSYQFLSQTSALFSINLWFFFFTEHLSIFLVFKIQLKMSLDKTLNLIHTHQLWDTFLYWIHEFRLRLNGRQEEDKGFFRLLLSTEWSCASILSWWEAKSGTASIRNSAKVWE